MVLIHDYRIILRTEIFNAGIGYNTVYVIIYFVRVKFCESVKNKV